MIERKRRGEKIHTSEAILNYQRSLLEGARRMDVRRQATSYLRFRAGKFGFAAWCTRTSTHGCPPRRPLRQL